MFRLYKHKHATLSNLFFSFLNALTFEESIIFNVCMLQGLYLEVNNICHMCSGSVYNCTYTTFFYVGT